MSPRNEEELEELLSRPSEADVTAMRELGGDLLILGVAGKMGPSLALRARRAATAAGVSFRVIGVSRFSSDANRRLLEEAGIETVSADLLDEDTLPRLPDAPNVIHMAARKFGSTGDEAPTWAMNAYLPARVAERFKHSRIVAFSSGNVYPLSPIARGGSMEGSALEPVGEYAMSAVARERLLTYMSKTHGTPMAILRLNSRSAGMRCSFASSSSQYSISNASCCGSAMYLSIASAPRITSTAQL